jgi:thioredoxin-like negative regulator of GroEL
VVDGLEHDMKGKVRFTKVDVGTDEGAKVAASFGLGGVPAFVLLDGQGRVLHRQVGGTPDRDAIRTKVAALGP